MAETDNKTGRPTAEKRWETIASSIKGAIRRGELFAGARIASETEMAIQWNVSPMTVHRALTELQQEGWVVRRRKVGTVVADRSAIPLTRVALIVTNPADLPQGAYITGIEESLREGYQLVAFNTYNNPAEEAKFLKSAMSDCSAIICFPTGSPENTAVLRKAASVKPLVLIDCLPEGLDADVVMTNNAGSMMAGLKHLKSLGHTRIAYFREHPHLVSSVQERYEGYIQFMTCEVGVEDPDLLVRSFAGIMSSEQYNSRVESCLIELLSERDPITAVACQQDSTMTAVIEVSVRLGLGIGSDIEILSFNDLPPKMQPFAHRVHRLVQRPIEMGSIAGKRIAQRLNSHGGPCQHMSLMAELYPAIPYTPSAAASAFISQRRQQTS